MARKAVAGYPEKSYYDNTVFNGIVATNDPLNEGSFALLNNFDIVDTGKSVLPRKGFTSTTFTIAGTPLVLSEKILTFRDPNIQKDIILDLNKITTDTSKFGYITDITQYNLTNNMLPDAHLITAYDAEDLINFIHRAFPALIAVENILKHILQNSTIIGDAQLQAIRDRYGVVYYIKKMHYVYDNNELKYWIKFLYREKQSVVGGVTYPADTLVISVVDTQEQTDNFLNRNLASKKSIIPSPLRTQELPGVEDSEVSDVNRPILLEVNGNYLTTSIPDTVKASLDIKVKPSFHLQDPERILATTGQAEKWAYRFDFINTAINNSTMAYKTPWRTLSTSNTMSGVNSKISQLDTGLENVNDETYTYYIVSEAPHSWLTTYAAESYLSSLSEAEEILYDKMRSNGVSGSSGSKLSNLAFAYLKHESLTNTLKPNSIQLEDIDPSIYNQMEFKFISEDELRPAVAEMAYDLDELTDRTLALSSATVTALTQTNSVYLSADTRSMRAPILPMTYTKYNATRKMNLSEFVDHAKQKEKTKKIRLVFVPFIYRRAGTVGTTDTDNVYLCSLAGIYINGLTAYDSSSTGDIADYDDVVSVPKEFTFNSSITEKYVDVFSNLGDLNIKDVISDIPRSVFDRGVFLVLYLKPYNNILLNEALDKTTNEIRLINSAWDESAYKQVCTNVWAPTRDVIYLDEVDDENPTYIENSNNHIVYEDRLVVWSGNKVYVSEEGDYYYFTNELKKTFPEEVLKVIAFKTILLVFTTQNLYAIYRAEVDTFTGAYTQQGTPEFEKTIVWLQQPVLYNINPDRRYLDVIQVYNQMILFYSNEGQLYMIKPSTMIDSETQFAIQYFNKSANNILSNYVDYINDRLRTYKKLDVDDPLNYVTEADVKVKALIDIDLIKIFYTVPNRITFVLVYDVVNNRYTTYDTLSFTDIDSVRHVEGGEFYITKEGSNKYLTLPVIGINNVDQNVDMHYSKMFKKEPIFGYIDSGNLNLNNHLNKRLRDLRIVLKNLDATKILYNAELVLDDTVIRPFYAPDFKVRMLNGPDHLMTVNKVPTEDLNELFGMNQTIGEEGARTDVTSYYLHNDADFFTQNSLLKTETLNSSKLIEYNSSILGLGKVIRIRLQFISKGKYKLQSFGIIYKERRV